MSEISDKAVEAGIETWFATKPDFTLPGRNVWNPKMRAALSAALPHLVEAAGVAVPDAWRACLANLAAVVRVQNGNLYDDINGLLAEASRLLDALVPSPVPQEATAEPVGWETNEEWELETRVCQAANRSDVPDDVRQTVQDLWKQYCLAADPARASPPSHDAELLAALRDVLAGIRVDASLMHMAVEANDPKGELLVRCKDIVRHIDAALSRAPTAQAAAKEGV
jgi:hypothetical protein